MLTDLAFERASLSRVLGSGEDELHGLSPDVTHCRGPVPIVRLNRLTSACRVAGCYVKLEGCSPSGSIKEKNAVLLVEQAEREGRLRPGGCIVESSSGNFGVGLAMVGAVRGYRVLIVIDRKTTPGFRRMLESYGAELVVLDPSEADASGSMQLARIRKARDLAASISGAWYPGQHHNPANPDAHALWTAREIEQAFPGRLDAVVAGVSTGGQLTGLAKGLLPGRPHLKLVAVDVEGSVILGGAPGPYKMTGMGLSFRPPHLDYEKLALRYIVPEKLAFSVCHALARTEGLLLGASTGAIVAAGLRVAATLPAGGRILMLSPDRGERYLDTVYNQSWLAEHGCELLSRSSLESAIHDLRCVQP